MYKPDLKKIKKTMLKPWSNISKKKLSIEQLGGFGT